MTVRSVYREMVEQEAAAERLRRGLLPETTRPEQETGADMFLPPPVVDGSIAVARDWEEAIRSLDRTLAAIEAALEQLKGKANASSWRELEAAVAKLETASRIKLKDPDGSAGQETYVFSHIPYLFDLPAEHLPENDCEIDFSRQCVSLKEEDGWCGRLDLDGSKVGWYLEPDRCKTTQAGSLESIVQEGGRGWTLVVSGSSRVVLHIEIALPTPAVCNSVLLDLQGRTDNIEVAVDGEKAMPVDRRATWFVFPQREISRISIAITKNSYDTDRDTTHYFGIRRVAAYLRRYKRRGVYVSHAVEVDGVEATVVPEVSLPQGTDVDLYLGFQTDNTVDWRRLESGQWVKLPWLQGRSEELFTYAEPAVTGPGGLYQLFRFEEDPVVSSIELYPGHGMWVVEETEASAGTVASLKDWTALKNTARVLTDFLDAGSRLALKNGRIYHLYTNAYVGPEDGGTIADWRPQPAGVPYSVYINRVEQVPERERYHLTLHPGWNLIELVVLPTADTIFDPLLYLEEAASATSAVRKGARIITVDELKSEGRHNLGLAAYHKGILYVNYAPSKAGFIRYLCRYYTKRGSRMYTRFMAAMSSATGNASPVLTGFTIKWR